MRLNVSSVKIIECGKKSINLNLPLIVFSSAPPEDTDVVELFNNVLVSNQVTLVSKQYALVALCKLSTRVKNGVNK